jgi:hypothetical protein
MALYVDIDVINLYTRITTLPAPELEGFCACNDEAVFIRFMQGLKGIAD